MFKKIKKILKKEPLLNCPRCNVKMEKIEKENVIIDVCPECNGIWLDDNEIEKLINISKKLNVNERIKKSDDNPK